MLWLTIMKVQLFMVIIFFSVSINENVFAQNNTISLNDIVVSASRYEENIFAADKAISSISSTEINKTNFLNMANALIGNVGICMQQSKTDCHREI